MTTLKQKLIDLRKEMVGINPEVKAMLLIPVTFGNLTIYVDSEEEAERLRKK